MAEKKSDEAKDSEKEQETEEIVPENPHFVAKDDPNDYLIDQGELDDLLAGFGE